LNIQKACVYLLSDLQLTLMGSGYSIAGGIRMAL
jgi:hypothetical protein